MIGLVIFRLFLVLLFILAFCCVLVCGFWFYCIGDWLIVCFIALWSGSVFFSGGFLYYCSLFTVGFCFLVFCSLVASFMVYLGLIYFGAGCIVYGFGFILGGGILLYFWMVAFFCSSLCFRVLAYFLFLMFWFCGLVYSGYCPFDLSLCLWRFSCFYYWRFSVL